MATEQNDKPPRRTHRAPAAAAAEHAPWRPVDWDPADALSVQRVAAGTAAPHEQIRAFKWIMFCTGYIDEPYRPGGEDGRRETDFALGKANVGRQIAKLLHMNLAALRGGEDREQV